MKPPTVGTPLPVEELEKDAAEAGAASDSAVAPDPSAPAGKPLIERDLANLPPG